MPTIRIHGQPGTGYPEDPVITADVSYTDVSRSGTTLSCDVSAVIGGMPNPSAKYGYFGYQITTYAQLGDGALVPIFVKSAANRRWSAGAAYGTVRVSCNSDDTSVILRIYTEAIRCGCTGQNTKQVMWSTALSAPPSAPPSITLTNAGYDATYISWTASANETCTEWQYSLDSQAWVAYAGSTTATSGALNVSSAIHNVTIRGKGIGGLWGYSNNLVWDCRIPNIENAVIKVTGDTQGTLSFRTDYNVKYYFNNVYLGQDSGNINVPVTLSSNISKGYSLRLERVENTAIQNSTTVVGDTTAAKVSLEMSVIGTDVTFTAASDVSCENWQLVQEWTDSSGSHVEIVKTSADVKTTWKDIVKDLTVNVSYTYYVKVVKTSNSTSAESNRVTVVPKGCVKIFHPEGTPITAGVYVFNNGSWRVAQPYVWSEGAWHISK